MDKLDKMTKDAMKDFEIRKRWDRYPALTGLQLLQMSRQDRQVIENTSYWKWLKLEEDVIVNLSHPDNGHLIP
jgi:hypothetical protein